MASVLNRSRTDDTELARRVSNGDGAAFALLDARHRNALTRYAGSLLRRSEHDAEDVVQDVLIRAHEALRAGDLPDDLQPWLYRLTRNRAIDEVRRKRWGDESLDSDHTFSGDRSEDPEAVLRGKETLRRIVEDLADLPVNQRVALLARELDGRSPEQVAEQLGVSVTAAHKLATRARANLIRSRDARDAACPDVRAALLDAHERGARPSEHAVLHVKACRQCRSYQRDIRRLRRQLHALNPALGLPVVAAVAHVVGGGAKAATAVAAVAVVATGGVVVLRSEVHDTGDPAPFRLAGLRDENGRPLTAGKPIPGRTAIVTTLVDIPALKAQPQAEQTVTIDCPQRMIFLGLVEPMRRAPLDWQITRDTIPGRSTTARLDLRQRDPKRVAKGTIGIICRRPAANGSLYPNPRKLQPGERAAHVCPGRWNVPIFSAPRGARFSQLRPGEPVAIQRQNATGRWTLVAHDYDPRWRRSLQEPGWIRTSELCP